MDQSGNPVAPDGWLQGPLGVTGSGLDGIPIGVDVTEVAQA